MRYFSTKNKDQAFSFYDAALTGLAPDGGLFIPQTIPTYRKAVQNSLLSMSFLEIAFETISPYVKGEMPDSALEDICAKAFTFPAPLVPVPSSKAVPSSFAGPDNWVLELFHGPTAAFKDFGARFMAYTFSWLRRGENRPLSILVATSGDTGGAVADGFFGVQGISVTVLYPKGRISELQEKQIAGFPSRKEGGNISALAVEGSFDDCQALVKKAFVDTALQDGLELSSANSINICRLIPQAVYYAAAAGKAQAELLSPICFCVPSGNFGNLTAGLYTKAMGAPIAGFIAATNINKTIPEYLENGQYKTRTSQPTISNAMDVGAPSNFERMAAHWNLDQLRTMIRGISINDDQARQAIADVYGKYGYYLDPHTAVGWAAAEKLKLDGTAMLDGTTAILSTAHPAKFSETVESITGPVPVPPSIQKAMDRKVQSLTIPADISVLRDFLLENNL